MIAIIQARYLSERLKGKVLLKIQNKTLIDHIIQRLSYSKKIKKIILATSTSKSDDKIANYYKNKKNLFLFRGSLNNVALRFFQVIKKNPCDDFIRITGD